jgi:Protein of unknown function (DUF3103)
VYRRLFVVGASLAIALGLTAGPAQAGPGGAGPRAGSVANAPDGAAASRAGSVAAITGGLARQLASTLAADVRQAGLLAAAAAGPVSLGSVPSGPALDRAVRAADRAVLAAKGLPTGTAPLLQLRLADPGMRAALDRGEAPLIAAPPDDDAATRVTAYGPDGVTVTLDAATAPQRPVFVVDVDTSTALAAGLDVLRTTLAAHGITGTVGASSGGYWATKVNAVRLSSDEEPWVKGAAEIFGIASGFGLDGHVKVDTLTMPYLDYDGTTYYPNQLIVHFSAYKYNLADFVMMEDDGDTNYQSLAVALASALLTIVDGGAYIPLVSAILNAMPTSWWTDDPDYVDSWYTLATSSSGHLNGARANGWMDVVPYWVQQF